MFKCHPVQGNNAETWCALSDEDKIKLVEKDGSFMFFDFSKFFKGSSCQVTTVYYSLHLWSPLIIFYFFYIDILYYFMIFSFFRGNFGKPSISVYSSLFRIGGRFSSHCPTVVFSHTYLVSRAMWFGGGVVSFFQTMQIVHLPFVRTWMFKYSYSFPNGWNSLKFHEIPISFSYFLIVSHSFFGLNISQYFILFFSIFHLISVVIWNVYICLVVSIVYKCIYNYIQYVSCVPLKSISPALFHFHLSWHWGRRQTHCRVREVDGAELGVRGLQI